MSVKLAHLLQLSYAAPEWPQPSKVDENSIVNQLVDLLKPIGDYRRSYVTPSKGKRSKKRKLNDLEQGQGSDPHATASHEMHSMPAIIHHLTIGFNSTSKALEALSQPSKPGILQDVESDAPGSEEEVSALGAVFVFRSVLPDLLMTSIPLMVAVASLAQLQNSAIRLVKLSGNAEAQFAEALHQPRVGFVGIQVDAPNAAVLLATVRAAVSPVHVPWLDVSQNPRYLPAQIKSTEMGSKKPKKTMKHPEQRPKKKPSKPAAQIKLKKKPNT